MKLPLDAVRAAIEAGGDHNEELQRRIVPGPELDNRLFSCAGRKRAHFGASMTKALRVGFFAKLSDPDGLNRIEFYKQDIDILRELGFDVVPATRWGEIPRDVDFYFVWWWQWAFLPMLKTIYRRRPCLVTGTFDFRWLNGKGDYFHRPPWQRWLMRYALENASASVFVSQLEYREVSQALKVENPVYIPHGVDTNLYRPGTQCRENIAMTLAWMHGGNSERKCVPDVIRAIPIIRQRHPEMRFIIAGEKGSDYPRLAGMAEDLGVSSYVEFPGVISREEKIDLMQRCKVYVSPSRYEGFGLAILEAMSCGAPVVSSPAGAVPEVVGEAGLLVDGNSPDAIAGAVNRYLDDEPFRQAMGHCGRVRAETVFPYSRRKRELGQVIESILTRE
jgi:glycosyltransferase involved in cell wall biosynthesis